MGTYKGPENKVKYVKQLTVMLDFEGPEGEVRRAGSWAIGPIGGEDMVRFNEIVTPPDPTFNWSVGQGLSGRSDMPRSATRYSPNNG